MDISAIDNRTPPDSVVLNAGQAGEKGSQFNQGEILKGVVREIKSDGIISLLINGKLVDAASKVKVSPGQNLYLLVDSFKNGLTYLRAITAQGSAQHIENNLSPDLRGAGMPSNADTILIADKLLQHDLPVNQQNIAAIYKALNMIGGITTRNLDMAIFLLQHNIPLDKNILPLIDQFISSDGDLSRLVRELIQLLTRMETLVRSDSPATSAPAAPAVVISAGSSSHAIAAAPNLNGAGTEPALTSKAASGSAENAGNPTASGNAANISPQGVSQQQTSIPMTTTLSIAPAAVDQGVAAPSNTAVQGAETAGDGTASARNFLIVTSPAPAATGETGSTAAAGESGSAAATGETGSAAAVENGSSSAAVSAAVLINTASAAVIADKSTPISNLGYLPPVNISSATPEPSATIEQKPLDLIEFSKILRAVLDSAVGKITQSGHDVNPVLQGLIKNRTLLLDNLQRLFDMVKADDMLNKTPAGQELLTKISNFQQQITGQALFNGSVKLGQDVFYNNYYFSFPVEIDNQLSYCQLRIQKNTDNQLEGQENIKFVVSLDTPALGIVMFHVDWHRQGYIQLQGVMETSVAAGFIEKNMGELLFNLGELGYSVNNLGVKTAREQEELVLKPQINETVPDKISDFSIDVIA